MSVKRKMRGLIALGSGELAPTLAPSRSAMMLAADETPRIAGKKWRASFEDI